MRALIVQHARLDEAVMSQSDFVAQNHGAGSMYHIFLHSLKQYQNWRPYRLSDGYENLKEVLLGVARSKKYRRNGLDTLSIADQCGLITDIQYKVLLREFEPSSRRFWTRSRSRSPGHEKRNDREVHSKSPSPGPARTNFEYKRSDYYSAKESRKLQKSIDFDSKGEEFMNEEKYDSWRTRW